MVRGQAWAPWAVQCLGFYVKAVLCLALGPSGYMHVLLGIDMCINKYNHKCMYIYVHDIYVHILLKTPF